MQLIHTCFWVADIDRSIAFYQRLGFQVWDSGQFRGAHYYAFLGLPDDGPRIELNAADGVGSYEMGTGYRHIAVTVEDMDATLAVLAEEGFEPDAPPMSLAEVPGTTVCYIRDPDGYELELWYPHGPEFPPPQG